MKEKILKYFEETKLELKKVTWPSKPEIIGSTIVVVVTSILISAFLYVVDTGLSTVVGFLLRQ
ncbi:MAG: preprotein translocase subunit SecE [bacterium]